mmetsp:Transcript_40791/g.117832  ORF Transcript_40791/g.117832 Transcript_40791/m.117832 type:complete len:123 (-) Transcript_40791:130-498(-)
MTGPFAEQATERVCPRLLRASLPHVSIEDPVDFVNTTSCPCLLSYSPVPNGCKTAFRTAGSFIALQRLTFKSAAGLFTPGRASPQPLARSEIRLAPCSPKSHREGCGAELPVSKSWPHFTFC